MKETLFVGGNFDKDGGRPSSVVNILSENIKNQGCSVNCINGGSFENLKEIYDSFDSEDERTVLWFPNVPNDEEKIRDVKSKSPKVILVTSKRNNGEYSFQEMVNRMLESKANLSLEFSKISSESKSIYKTSVYDPLGNSWASSTDLSLVTQALVKRLSFLSNITRQNTISCPGEVEIVDNQEFFEIIKQHAETFHNLIHPVDEVKRFLGNASFRCERGFPSFRGDSDIIYVSRRNIDKRFVDKENFVPVRFEEDEKKNGSIYYYGKNKPSVDTPIQVRLYKEFPYINYMLHSHCYIEGAPFTKESVPCGAVEEVGEITNLIKENYSNDSDYFINLIGHGSIVMSKDLGPLKNIEYIGRPVPEDMSKKQTRCNL